MNDLLISSLKTACYVKLAEFRPFMTEVVNCSDYSTGVN